MAEDDRDPDVARLQAAHGLERRAEAERQTTCDTIEM